MTARRLLCAWFLMCACDPKPSTPPDSGAGASEAPPGSDERSSDDEMADDEDGDASSKRPPPVEHVLEIDGKLPEAQVEKLLQDHVTEIQACYDEALQNPDQEQLKGAIVVRFVVPSSGEVSNPEIELTEFAHAPTEACIAAVVDGFVFPKQKGESTVHLPFYMSNF